MGCGMGCGMVPRRWSGADLCMVMHGGSYTFVGGMATMVLVYCAAALLFANHATVYM